MVDFLCWRGYYNLCSREYVVIRSYGGQTINTDTMFIKSNLIKLNEIFLTFLCLGIFFTTRITVNVLASHFFSINIFDLTDRRIGLGQPPSCLPRTPLNKLRAALHSAHLHNFFINDSIIGSVSSKGHLTYTTPTLLNARWWSLNPKFIAFFILSMHLYTISAQMCIHDLK